jgi:hypothetical protein
MSKVIEPFNNLDDKAIEEIKKRINEMKVGNRIVSNKSPNIPKFSYFKASINCYTFKVPKIREWIENHCEGLLVLNLFGGTTRLTKCIEISNDLAHETIPKKGKKPERISTTYHLDALDCIKMLNNEIGQPLRTYGKFDVVIIDTPYSFRKSMEFYQGHKASKMPQIHDIIPNILAPNGKVITFGYWASAMGAKRGFYTDEVAIFDHSGAIHSTLACVEKRIQ